MPAPSSVPELLDLVQKSGVVEEGRLAAYAQQLRNAGTMPADPSKLNANLYVRENNGSIRQLTFLLNQELLPTFMRDGRVIFTNEKRAPDFSKAG